VVDNGLGVVETPERVAVVFVKPGRIAPVVLEIVDRDGLEVIRVDAVGP
jgi:hypothetical protein